MRIEVDKERRIIDFFMEDDGQSASCGFGKREHHEGMTFEEALDFALKVIFLLDIRHFQIHRPK